MVKNQHTDEGNCLLTVGQLSSLPTVRNAPMSTATLTSKGQITLPQAVRQALGVEAGDKLDFVADKSGGFRVVALRQDARRLRRPGSRHCELAGHG
jgi:AbrB family looped-hinge helix DNA binding protein